MTTEPSLDEVWRAVWRDERAPIVGSLARRFGDLTLAEDAVQEALAAAAVRWPVDGTPDRPGAWLTTTAYRKAIGMLRKQRPSSELDDELHDPTAAADLEAAVQPAVSDDDLFALILTCCHPALSPDARVALTLRHVCGLRTSEIAAAFLVAEPTMVKRLVRARHKIRHAGIGFDPPDEGALLERLHDVRAVVYLVFNEGYLAAGDEPAIRGELCEEAIWLAEHLHEVHRDDENAGLLALLLVQHARRWARQDATGRLIPFDEQERDRWDREAIGTARAVMATTSGRVLGPYQIEAAIALLHVSGDRPDWSRIADLYGVLSRVAPSSVVEVNRAFAVASADGPRAGLSVLAPVLDAGQLVGYPSMHAVHAELLDRDGQHDEARAAWARASAVSANPAQRVEFDRRARRVGHAC